MNFSKNIFLALFLLLGILSASADKMSPDTRIRFERRSQLAPLSTEGSSNADVQVFIAFEPGFDTDLLNVEGVEVQSVFGKVATAKASMESLEALCALDGVRYVQMASEVKLLNDFSRRELSVNKVHGNLGKQLPQGYLGNGVIVGLIDTGVEYGHRAFYSLDGSELRIRKAWEQEGYGKAPEGYTYGNELTTPEELLQAATDSRYAYHGSHTMGTAAGGGDLITPYYGMAPGADIIFVSFKNDDNTCIADAIKYIFDYADEMDMPCVINMSLGSHHGPHDGTSYLDQIIDEMVGPGRIIVGACGNEGEARMHASKTFTETDKTMKTMMTFNKNQSHKLQYIDIWGTPGSNLKVKLAVFNSLKGQTVDSSNAYDTSDPNRKMVGYFTYIDEVGVDIDAIMSGEINPENNSPHIWIEATIGDMGQGRMPGLIIEGDAGATVNVWNEGQHEFSSNNRSGFTDGDNQCTVGEVGGTARRIITVGSYDGRDTLPMQRKYYIDMKEQQAFHYEKYGHSWFSSCGPTADGRTVPHILAPGIPVVSAVNRHCMAASELDEVMSDYTTDKSGRKYYYVYSIGTSMSAPQVAGIVALMLQANPELTPEQAREIIQSTADTWEAMGTVPNNSFGAGRINALKCVQGALELINTNGIDNVEVDDNATQVWGSNGMINILSPAVGSTLRLYSVTGTLLKEITLDSTSTVIDASQWSHRIMIAEVIGKSTRSTFKITL